MAFAARRWTQSTRKRIISWICFIDKDSAEHTLSEHEKEPHVIKIFILIFKTRFLWRIYLKIVASMSYKGTLNFTAFLQRKIH